MKMQSGITLAKREAIFAGIPVAKLTRKFDTPLLVFSEQRLIDNFESLKKAFKKYYQNSNIYYSIKTNSEIQILKTLKNLGSRGEAASGLEIILAEKAGFIPSDLIVDGPAWTDEDITLYIRKGVKTLNVDSLDLMMRVNKIAGSLNKKVRVTYRIYPEMKMSILKSLVEGYIAKFGIPLSKAIEIYSETQKMKNVTLVGVSAHIGSMITDPGYYEKAIDKLVNLAGNLKKKLGINIEEINIGGGFGLQSLNYFSMQNVILEKAGISSYEKAATIEEFGKRIAQKFIKMVKKNKLDNPELILEPGRFLVSDTGILLTTIVSKKDHWIFINGGINLIPESIFFIRRGFLVDKKIGNKLIEKYNIAGPTLNTADVLATEQRLPETQVGDTIIVLDAGAYSLTRSNQFTILRPDCLYIKSGGKVKFLRHKENPKDILSKMLP